MKALCIILFLATIALTVFFALSVPIDDPLDSIDTSAPEKYKALNYEDVKAMWLTQYDLSPVYTDGGEQRSENDFRDRIHQILQNVKGLGINTIFVQVRPFGDSFYPSKIYPTSAYVCGKYGGELSYDPFAIILEEAHAIYLSVHAWINPLRAMRDGEISVIADNYKIKQWYNDKRYDYIVSVSGRWYLNPAYEEVRALISDGAAEIVSNYNIDGVHIDDYFYPTTDEEFDKIAYRSYKQSGGELSLADFRRENINSLVKELYGAVKSENESVLFGVSPSGVMKNNYNELYADVSLWCENKGYIDYLCPQLYFGFLHDTCAFDKLSVEFSAMVKLDSIKLIYGLSLGKAASGYDTYAGSGKYEWRDHKDILYRQLSYTQGVENCSGVAFFSYQYFYDVMTGERVAETSSEVAKLLPLLKTISWS